MAVVGEAYVVVRAVTNRVLPDIQRSLNGVKEVGRKSGSELSEGLMSAFGPDKLAKFDELSEKFEESRVKLRRFSTLFRFLAPTIVGVVGAIGAVIGGLTVFVAAVGNAARGSIVFGASLMALITALVTARGLFGGIADAYKAKINAQKASGKSNAAEEAALKRLEKARIKLKRLIEEEAPEALAAARERAADAARSAADAILGAERAQRSYNDAQKAAFDALEDLNGARDRAREKLQQLRFELEGAAIGEKRARLEFEKARDSLQAVQDLPPNSRARQEAELAFAQAELNLRKAIDSNSDLKKEEDAATRAGVEGSKDVVDAKDALAKAQQREADLAIDTARAFESAARAQRDAQRAASDAAAGGRVERELNRRIADAREAVIDAERDLANARKNAAGNNALADAYKNLNAAGITVVETLARLQKLFIELRKETSTPFLTLVNSALLILEANLFNFAPLIEETGRIVGQLALNFAKAFLEGEGADRLRNVWSTNNILLERLGNTALNLAQAFLIVLQVAQPLIDAFGRWAESKSASFLADLNDDTSELSKTFENVQRNVSLLGQLFGKLGEAFGIIGEEINKEGGAAQILLEGLVERATNWVTTLTGLADSGELSDLFTTLSENFLLILDIIGSLIGAFIELGASPGMKPFLESIQNIVDALSEVGEEIGEEGGALEKFGEFLELLVDSALATFSAEAVMTFFKTLNDILGPVVTFLESDAFVAFFDQVAPIIAQAAAVGFAWRAAKFAIEAFLGTILLIATPIALVVSKLTGFGAALASPGMTMAKAIPMMLRFLGIVGLVVGVLIGIWTNSEAFRTSIMALFESVMAVFKGAFDDIDRAVQQVFPQFSGSLELISAIFKGIGDFLSVTLIPLIGFLIGRAVGLISGLVQRFIYGFGAIKNLLGAFKDFFVGIFKFITGDFEGGFKMMESAIEKFKQFFIMAFKALIAPVAGMFNGIVDAWNNTAGKFVINIPTWVPFIGGQQFSLPKLPRIMLAKGGIVPATRGGMLATIGEAGRPERVEPLDPDGLSKRDKAMIDKLSSSGVGSTINVYPSQGMDERELAELVSRKLAYQMRRGSI